MTVRLVGLSHHVAPVEVRERVALDIEAAGELCRALTAGGGEAVCLSTCNRTELYVVEPAVSELDGPVYRLEDEEAALHLFRVAAGLDSMVPGEAEILGQVRAAFEAGSTGPILDRLFRQALHVGKKARSETAIGESPASVSSAAAALAQQVFGDLIGRRVLVIGAGKAAELVITSLAARGATIACVAGRSIERARALAERFGARAVSAARLEDELADADIVVSCTSARGHVVTREQAASRRRGPLVLIDIAVPRDLDPAINELDGCYLYDIDDLQAVVDETLAGRRREAERAEALAAAETRRFGEWLAERDVVPAIASLRAHAERIRRRELERAGHRLSEDDRRTVEAITAQIVNKLLHLPTVRMKEAAATTDGAAYASALEHLFGLEGESR
jgi:glutamyl-tRNA reductase